MSEIMDLEIEAGEEIGHACRRAAEWASEHNCPIAFVFNGTRIEAAPGETVDAIRSRWWAGRYELEDRRRMTIAAERRVVEAAVEFFKMRQYSEAAYLHLLEVAVNDLLALRGK